IVALRARVFQPLGVETVLALVLTTAIITSPFWTPVGTFSVSDVDALAELAALDRYWIAGHVIDLARSARVSVTPTATPAPQLTVAVFTPVAPVPLCTTSAPRVASVLAVAMS